MPSLSPVRYLGVDDMVVGRQRNGIASLICREEKVESWVMMKTCGIGFGGLQSVGGGAENQSID